MSNDAKSIPFILEEVASVWKEGEPPPDFVAVGLSIAPRTFFVRVDVGDCLLTRVYAMDDGIIREELEHQRDEIRKDARLYGREKP